MPQHSMPRHPPMPPVRLILSGWPPDVEVGPYTVDGLENVQRQVAQLRKLNLPADEYRRRAREIMETRKQHDAPMIAAYIEKYGIPALDGESDPAANRTVN
jgi:hypothetical protein